MLPWFLSVHGILEVRPPARKRGPCSDSQGRMDPSASLQENVKKELREGRADPDEVTSVLTLHPFVIAACPCREKLVDEVLQPHREKLK